MQRLIGPPSLDSAWSIYTITKPFTTRSGKLPGQRAEHPRTPEELLDWLTDLEGRGVLVTWQNGVFTFHWPTLESYCWWDVERTRVNWSALLTHFKLRPLSTKDEIPKDTPLSRLPLVFLDTETTGLSGEDRLIELYLSHAEKSFYSRFDPEGRQSSPEAFKTHRIPDEDLIGEPFFKEKADEIADHLDGAVIVAHNAPFDVRFLKQEFGLAGLEWAPCAQVDTIRVAKKLWPDLPSYKLSHLADHFGIPHLADHTAAGDVITLQALWNRLCERLPVHATLNDLL